MRATGGLQGIADGAGEACMVTWGIQVIQGLLSLNETPPDSIESWIPMEMKLDWEWQNSTWIYILYHWDLLTQKPVVGNRVLARWDSHRCPKRGECVIKDLLGHAR